MIPGTLAHYFQFVPIEYRPNFESNERNMPNPIRADCDEVTTTLNESPQHIKVGLHLMQVHVQIIIVFVSSKSGQDFQSYSVDLRSQRYCDAKSTLRLKSQSFFKIGKE